MAVCGFLVIRRSQSGPHADGHTRKKIKQIPGPPIMQVAPQAIAPSPAHHRSPLLLARMRRNRGRVQRPRLGMASHWVVCAVGQGGGKGVGAGGAGGCGAKAGGATALADPHDGERGPRRRSAPVGCHRLRRHPGGPALCCDATLVSPLTRTGLPQPCAAETDGARRCGWRKDASGRPTQSSHGATCRGWSCSGPKWKAAGMEAHEARSQRYDPFACRVTPTVRQAAAAGWARRWCGVGGHAGAGCEPGGVVAHRAGLRCAGQRRKVRGPMGPLVRSASGAGLGVNDGSITRSRQ